MPQMETCHPYISILAVPAHLQAAESANLKPVAIERSES